MIQIELSELKKKKEEMLANTRKLVSCRHIHGQPMEVEIKGVPHKMLYYSAGEKKAPVYFDIHGGGFCWGMMEEGDLFCHKMNEQLGFHAFALDYPRTPEAGYPQALYWLYDTIHYIWEHAGEFDIDPKKMVIGGRSAGGNLSAALCLLAKECGEFQFACQVLDHPYLDLCGLINDAERYAGEEALTPDLMELLASSYATAEQRREAFCSPLNASDEQLKDLPPAVIQTCELDSLRLDGDRYATRLATVGIPVVTHCYPQVAHAFTELEGPEEKNGQQWLIEGIKKLIL